MPTLADWHDLAAAAETIAMRHFRAGGAVESKPARGFDPVTEADREVERALRAIVAERFPRDAVLGEELGASDGPGEDAVATRRWVIDPIDGTRAFVAGVPTWMTLVGLEEGGRAVAGLAVQPVTGERFLAAGGEACVWRTGIATPLHVRDAAPAEAVVMTVDPFLFEGAAREGFDAVRRGTRLARYSADAYAFCALAAGSVQIVIETGLQPYDVAALIPIVEGAGGIVTTWEGDRAEGGGDVIACASPALHEWALSRLADAGAVRNVARGAVRGVARPR